MWLGSYGNKMLVVTFLYNPKEFMEYGIYTI